MAGISFEAVALERHASKPSGWSARYAARWIERMEKDFVLWIRSLPLQEVTSPLPLRTLRRIEDRGAQERWSRPRWISTRCCGPIPAAKMKRTLHGEVNARPHLVPLARCAVAILRELHPLSGHGRYVFPSLLTGERCMSENTLRTALRRMGYANAEMTPHGFRAMARTAGAGRWVRPTTAPSSWRSGGR